VILDEMNLARVEHYFSDFLSSLESGEAIELHDILAIEEGENEDAIPVPRTFVVPPNVYFTGTVNVDETTYMFSPKVLDRAFTIEFNTVDLSRLGTAQAPSPTDTDGLVLTGFSGEFVEYDAPHSDHWKQFGALEDGRLRDVVIALHEVLEAEQRHFGYRVANEIARFVMLAYQQSDGTSKALEAALDLAILEKVLPKLHGTQQELGTVLVQLFDFAVFGERRTPAMEPGMLERAWMLQRDRLVMGADAQEHYHQPRLPRTAAKVWTMLRRLRQQGFTSFIG
jgi:5-methylcytosine-specific restriction enzyme B